MKNKARCHNCKFAGQTFRAFGTTHLHCESDEMKEYFETSEQPSVWESLRVFSSNCENHQFKKVKARPLSVERLGIRFKSSKHHFKMGFRGWNKYWIKHNFFNEWASSIIKLNQLNDDCN